MHNIAWIDVPVSVLLTVVSDIFNNISKNKYLAVFLAVGICITSFRIFRNMKKIS